MLSVRNVIKKWTCVAAEMHFQATMYGLLSASTFSLLFPHLYKNVDRCFSKKCQFSCYKPGLIENWWNMK